MSVRNAGGSAMSDFIAGWSIVIEGEDRVKRISGKIAGAYKPGYAVYESDVDKWTAVTSSSAMKTCGWVDFKRRTSATFGEVSIDTAGTSADNSEIVVGPRDGTIKIGAYSDDLDSVRWYGYPLTGGAVGGALDHIIDLDSCRIQCIITEQGNITGSAVFQAVYIV